MVRVRQHVNPMKVEFRDLPVPRVEAPDREIEVELGCAEAWFLFQRTEARPDVLPIGIEIRREHVDAVNQRARLEGSPVRAIFAHMNHDLPRIFSSGQIARVFVNFPDPWFKKRHHKRRVMDAALIEQIARLTRAGGELFFQSDVWEVALDAMAVLEQQPELFTNRAGAWSFWKQGNPYRARSRREEVCEAEGTPIWRMLYERA